jgi:glycosyltransferase involved in cell wall biosynthesis
MKEPLFENSILPWEQNHTPDIMDEIAVENTRLSIVIPIFNSGKFLEKTIRSLMLSDLRNVQIIVRDGASTDNTQDILLHYKDIIDIVISEKDEGQSDAINKGFDLADGEIFFWLNGDDIVLPDALSIVRNFYLANNRPQLMVGNAYMTEINFDPIHHFVYSCDRLEHSYLLDYAKNHLIQPSVFFSAKAWETCGPLDIDDHYAMDADLFISMTKAFKALHIDRDLAYSVYHKDCKTRHKRAESIAQLALVQAKHGGLYEARKTLAILVTLYNEVANRIVESPISYENIIAHRLSLNELSQLHYQAILECNHEVD